MVEGGWCNSLKNFLKCFYRSHVSLCPGDATTLSVSVDYFFPLDLLVSEFSLVTKNNNNNTKTTSDIFAAMFTSLYLRRKMDNNRRRFPCGLHGVIMWVLVCYYDYYNHHYY